MKKEFSFYEFTGILVPSVTLLYCITQIVGLVYGIHLVDFSKIGDSVVFFIIAYGFGHILQAIGNGYESIFWLAFGGMPTQWLTKKSWFPLFDTAQTTVIKTKVFDRFGNHPDKDFGRDVYNWLSLKDNLTDKRIDIFMSNYSMFRGLTVTFYILTILVSHYFGAMHGLVPLAIGLLANQRMYRFAVIYAREVFRSFLNYQIS